MRVKEKIDEMRFKFGVGVEQLGFLIRDSTTDKVITAFRYDKSYLYSTDMAVDEAQIPYHRILVIYYKSQAIWQKRELTS